jgi:hypothetical protein
MAAFRQAALDQFEDGMVSHLRSFAPTNAKVLGDAALREVVRYGHGRALRHRFSLRGPVRFYIELIFLLGSEFDTDPQFPWAATILAEASADELLRADRLHASTMAYIEAVGGPENEYAKAALRRIKASGLDRVPAAATFEAEALAEMRRIHPEKYDYVGHAGLVALIEAGSHQAEALGAPEPADRAFCVGLMFALGHGFARDPHLPWVQKPLADQTVPGPVRLAALKNRVRIYLDAMLLALEGA